MGVFLSGFSYIFLSDFIFFLEEKLEVFIILGFIMFYFLSVRMKISGRKLF